nr:serpin family protein [uncultured Actinotalea sp.]
MTTRPTPRLTPTGACRRLTARRRPPVRPGPAASVALPLLAGVALPLLAACAGSAPEPVVHRGEVRAVAASDLTAQDVAAAQRSFGVELVAAVCAGRPGENVLVSATSAAEALGLLHPAADGATAAALGELLHLPPWSDAVVAAMRDRTTALAALRTDERPEEGGPDSLRSSNHLWTSPAVAPTRGYLDDIATAFDAQVEALDFATDADGATDRINASVREDTAGLIESLYDAPLPPATVAVLTNTLHLQARWATPFTETTDAPFTTPAGPATVPMVHGSTGAARTAAGWTSVELPYVDGTLVAHVVLPPEGTDPCATTGSDLEAVAAASPVEVGLSMPRLHLEQEHRLLPVLEGMGLPLTGDYPGLGLGDLAISDVVQKVYLDVDEEGTEAAAATGIGLAGSAPGEREHVVVDRPYLLLLSDTATGSPLFTAVVQDPTSGS